MRNSPSEQGSRSGLKGLNVTKSMGAADRAEILETVLSSISSFTTYRTWDLGGYIKYISCVEPTHSNS